MKFLLVLLLALASVQAIEIPSYSVATEYKTTTTTGTNTQLDFNWLKSASPTKYVTYTLVSYCDSGDCLYSPAGDTTGSITKTATTSQEYEFVRKGDVINETLLDTITFDGVWIHEIWYIRAEKVPGFAVSGSTITDN